jgi:hypothetical protein
VVDGRSRIEAAHRLGEETIDAYVINEKDLPPEEFAKLRRSLNERRQDN